MNKIKSIIISFVLVFFIGMILPIFKVQASATPIIGQPQLTQQQLLNYFRTRNNEKSDEAIKNFISIVWQEASIEGIRPDVVFIQIMKETDFLKFTGDVKESQNNFGGIGATGGGECGFSFKDIRTGIRAVVQHLKAYCSKEPLKNSCLDPRFTYVQRGISPYIEWLGIGENPNYPDKGWAEDDNYGKSIISMLESAKKLLNDDNEKSNSKATAKIQTYDVMLESQYITSDKLVSGKTYTIKGYASSTNGVLYEFWVKEVSTGVWTKVRDYKENRYANWTPNKSGQYVIGVNVKDKYSSTSSMDGRVEKTFTVESQSGKAKIQTYDIMSGSQYITSGKLVSGKTYTIKGYASSPNGVLYELWVKEVSTGVWTKVRDYKEDRYANWTPNKSGQYVIGVNVKDKYSSTSSMDGRVEKTFTVESQSGKAKIQTYDIILGSQYITNSKLVSGKTYTIKGYASSPNGVLYEFWVKEVSTGVWTKVRDYKEDRYANWTPNKSGQYVIGVNVKDKYSSTSSMDGRVEKTFTVESQSAKAKIQTYDIMLGSQYITNSKLVSGKTYTIKGYASSPNGVLYEFWVKEVSTGVWKKIRDYKEDRYANWTPNKSGQYVIGVNVKDKYSSTSSMDGRVEKTFTVESQSGKAKIQTYDIMLGSQYITNSKLVSGKTYTIKGYASSPNGVLYEFWVKEVSTGVWTKVRDYKEDRYANWTPNKSGQYVIGVNVKDKYSSTSSMDGRVEKTFTVESQSGKAKIQTYDIMLGNQYITNTKLDINTKYTIKAYASSGNSILYEFWIKDIYKGNWIKIRDYKEDRFATFSVNDKSRYIIKVNVKDKYSANNVDSYVEKNFIIGDLIKTIVLDAGHGGKDPGAISSRVTGAIHESDIVQKITIKLGELLKRDGYNVIYTRDKVDTYNYPSVTQNLEDRISVANKIKADLFMSIHADSANSSSANGFGAHYSSYRPRLDNSGTYNENGVTYDKTPCDAALKSKILSQLIVNEMASLGATNRGIHDHNLYVTRNALMPSALVETGFVSNDTEVRKLNSDFYQKQIAQKLYNAITKLFNM